MRWLLILLILGLFTQPGRTEETPPPAETGATFSAEGEATSEAPAPAAPESPVTSGQNAERPWELTEAPDKSVSIRKIYDFLNDPKKTQTGSSKSIAYEFKYFNHGAITDSQKLSRQGQYFVVSWANKGEPADYVLRMDYRQSGSRDRVRTMEIPFAKARGSYKGTFSVTGKDYQEFGIVHSWRISVVRNGQIVAQERSFVW